MQAFCLLKEFAKLLQMLSKPVLCNFILSIEMATQIGACSMQFLIDGSEICTEAPVLNASLAAREIYEEPAPALVLSSTASGTEASEGVFESGHAHRFLCVTLSILIVYF